MKKITLLFLFISFFAFGQNFPENEVQLLMNKEIKVKEMPSNAQEYAYDGFYMSDKLKDEYMCCDSYNSKYNSLVNKLFIVEEITPYIDIIGVKRYKLKIINPEIGILFFDYDTRYRHSFPFEVIGGLDLPEDFYCKKLVIKKDKFEDIERIFTPIVDGVSFVKVIIDKQPMIYLAIRNNGYTANVSKKGLYILLKNGSKISKPNADIDVEVNKRKYKDSDYIYSAFEILTKGDISMLLENNITDTRLFVYDREVDIESSNIIKEYLKCIVK